MVIMGLMTGVELSQLYLRKNGKLKYRNYIPLGCVSLLIIGAIWVKSGKINQENLRYDVMTAYGEQMNQFSRNLSIALFVLVPSLFAYSLYTILSLYRAIVSLRDRKEKSIDTSGN